MAPEYHRSSIMPASVTASAAAAASATVPAEVDEGREDTAMLTVRIDAQGRIVVPLAERQRLGVEGGDELALIPTPEGLILERRRAATVSTAPDGLPIVEFAQPRPVPNKESVSAIRAERAAR